LIIVSQKIRHPTTQHVAMRLTKRGAVRISWKLLTDLPVRSREEAIGSKFRG